jgi:RNA polymerase sigma factor (sigma-70 family)
MKADDRIIEVYRHERGQIARSVARIAGDSAEDIVHDAFETYLSHAPWALRPGAWISRAARNRALNTRRGIRLVPLDGHDETPAEDIDELEREVVGSVVAEALTALPERPRRALRMRFFEGASYEDVAEALGVRVPQAHVVVHRALRMLGRTMVRRMADAHGAAACAPALARMAGIGGDEEHGHGLEPCRACRPAWDEIAALRAVNGFVPWFLGLGGGFRRALRRMLEGTAKRPEVVEPAGRFATTMMAVGVAAASALTVPAAVASSVQAATGSSHTTVVGSVSGAPASSAVSGASVAAARGARAPKATRSVVGSPAGGMKENPDGSKQIDTHPPVQPPGGSRLGVIVCPPGVEDCLEP